MKRTVLLMIALVATLMVMAQDKGFVCTGDHVNVRTGPGTNYPIYGVRTEPGNNFPIYDGDTGQKRQLNKGDVVADHGESKNGFCLVSGRLEWGGDEGDGWVSKQFLRPVILCPTCFGTKEENIAPIDIDLAPCSKCNARGYIKILK